MKLNLNFRKVELVTNFLLIPIFMVVLLSACVKKEEPVDSFTASKSGKSLDKMATINPNDVFNPDNPYDTYGLNLGKVWADIGKVKDHPNISRTVYEDTEQIVLNRYSQLMYPTIDTSDYSLDEAKVILTLLEDLNSSNIATISREKEGEILSSQSFTPAQKNRLLSIVSQIKFNYLFLLNTYDPDINAFLDFNDCLDSQMIDIFDDDNPVEDIGFIAGIPYTFLWTVAWCSYDSLF